MHAAAARATLSPTRPGEGTIPDPKKNPKKIIGIHGLANKPPREEKAGWWADAIREGLARNVGPGAPGTGGHPAGAGPAALPFAFVYWADLRHPEPLTGGRNREPYEPAPGAGPFPSPAGDPGRRAPTLTDRAYRLLARAQEATGLTPVDDLILESRLDDLWGYHDDAAFRDAARARLRAALAEAAGQDVLLVAHSMGGLIAYDVLRAAEADGAPLPRLALATLGSPLGLAEVKLAFEAEHGPLRVPGALAAWTNLVDREDIATVGEDCGDAYAPNAAGVPARDVAVINAYRAPDGRENRHKSYGYLRTPEFSRLVADFLG